VRMKLSPLEARAFASKPRELSDIEATHEAMNEDQFRMIGDWMSIAILNLAKLKSNRADVSWIAKRLASDAAEAQTAFERLLRLKLIEVKGQKMVRTSRPLTTTSDIPSEAIKKLHLDLSVDDRDVTAIVMPADPLKLQEAKKILKRTCHRIAKLVETDKTDDVYVLAMQFFPLTLSPNDPSAESK
jgi:uncharacterized protein (TIGR02147 family)